MTASGRSVYGGPSTSGLGASNRQRACANGADDGVAVTPSGSYPRQWWSPSFSFWLLLILPDDDVITSVFTSASCSLVLPHILPLNLLVCFFFGIRVMELMWINLSPSTSSARKMRRSISKTRLSSYMPIAPRDPPRAPHRTEEVATSVRRSEGSSLLRAKARIPTHRSACCSAGHSDDTQEHSASTSAWIEESASRPTPWTPRDAVFLRSCGDGVGDSLRRRISSGPWVRTYEAAVERLGVDGHAHAVESIVDVEGDAGDGAGEGR